MVVRDQCLQSSVAMDGAHACQHAYAHPGPQQTWWKRKSTTFVSSWASAGLSHDGRCSAISPSSSPSCWLAAVGAAAAAAAAATRGRLLRAQPAGAAARPTRRLCGVGGARRQGALGRNCSCERLAVLRLQWSCCRGLLHAFDIC